VRPIVLVQLDKVRPALVLTRSVALEYLDRVTIAPITSTIRGISTEVPLGAGNGLDYDCVASCDNITTVSQSSIVKQVGLLLADQEDSLAQAIAAAFDLV
jgi:mRNA interferase MazF